MRLQLLPFDRRSQDSSSGAPGGSGCCACSSTGEGKPDPSAERNLPEWRSPVLLPSSEASAAAAGSGGRGRSPARRRRPRWGAGWGRGGRGRLPGRDPRAQHPAPPSQLPCRPPASLVPPSPTRLWIQTHLFPPGFFTRLVWRGPSGAMPMDVILVVWFCVCTARTGKCGWGGGWDRGKGGSSAAVPSAHTGVGRPGA